MSAIDKIKKSLKASIYSGAEASGMLTQKQSDTMLKKGGIVIDDGTMTDQEKKAIKAKGGKVMTTKGVMDAADEAVLDPIITAIYRYGLLLVVASLAIMSLIKMLPVEQIVKVVPNK